MSAGLNLLSLYYLEGQSKAIKDTNEFAEKTQKDYWNNQVEALKESFSHLPEFSKKLSLWEEDIKAEKIKLDYVYRNGKAIARSASLEKNISSGNQFLWVSFYEAEEVFIKSGVTTKYHAITGNKNEFLKPGFEGKIDFPGFWFAIGLEEFNIAGEGYMTTKHSFPYGQFFGYKELKISKEECLPYFRQALQCFKKVLVLTEQNPYSKIRYEAQKK